MHGYIQCCGYVYYGWGHNANITDRVQLIAIIEALPLSEGRTTQQIKL